MKKTVFAVALALCLGSVSATVISTLPGEVDMTTFTDSAVKSGTNGQAVSTDENVYVCTPNQMESTVASGAISLYSTYGANTSVSYAGFAMGYVGGGNDTTYATTAGSSIYFSMDFTAADGEDGTPDFYIRLNDGANNTDPLSRWDLDWTSTVDLGAGSTRYIFDSSVSGWEMPEFAAADATEQFGIFVAMGSAQGFSFNQVVDGESLYIGEVTGLTLQIPEPATFGLLGLGALGVIFVRRFRA